MRRLPRFLLVAIVSVLATAFAGSRDAYFAGSAGPYYLRAVVHTPGVIPGLANITVAVPNPEEITRVSVQPIFWDIPAERAPAPDIARRAAGGEFHASLWFMVGGSYGVRINVEGSRGTGTVVVPVTAVAYERLDMSRGMAFLLLALALFLGGGLVTIVRSAARESTLPAGALVEVKDRRRGWLGLAAGCLVVTGVFFGGRSWWSSVDARYRQRLYQPPETRATIVSDPFPTLRVVVRDSTWVALRHAKRPLVQDGRQLAHLFLVGENAFAHLHPVRTDSTGWQTALPPIPPGTYRVFTEVVDSTGFSETLTSSVEIPALDPGKRNGNRSPAGPDGYWFLNSDQRDCVVVSDEYPCRRLKDDVSVTLRTDHGFAFQVRTPADQPLPIDWSEPEAADAFILKTTGEVVHLRPHGTMPAAAIVHYGGTPIQPNEGPGEVRFPYPLPRSAGERVWLSLHAGGKRLVVWYDLAAGNP